MTWKVILLGLAILSAAATTRAATPNTELVMLEAAGCPWCQRWDREIGIAYAKTPEGRCAPLRRVDIHATLPPDLKGLSRGGFTPTFVLLEAGREIGRIRGYPGEDFFYPMLNGLLARLPSPCGKAAKTN